MTIEQLAFFFTTIDGITVNYDSIFIFSFIDEEGEVMILNTKVFSDPEQRELFHTEAAKGLAREHPLPRYKDIRAQNKLRVWAANVQIFVGHDMLLITISYLSV